MNSWIYKKKKKNSLNSINLLVYGITVFNIPRSAIQPSADSRDHGGHAGFD